MSLKTKEYRVNSDNKLANIKSFNKHIKCDDCRRCYESCPTKAIHEGNNNCNICLSYITQKKHIDDHWFLKLEGRIFGCDSCQTSCPYNDNISLSPLMEFKPLEYMINLNLDELLSMDNFIFRNKYASTACGWRGKNLLKRNALIAARNYEIPMQNLIIESTYLRDYYNRLFKLELL